MQVTISVFKSQCIRFVREMAATSLVVPDGKRLLSFESPDSAIWLLEWDLHTQNVTSRPPVIHTTPCGRTMFRH